MNHLHVGNLIRNKRRLYLPEEAVTQTFSIIAKRGAGKTHTGMVLAEEMIGLGYQVVIIDPLDVWWGLRASADGKKAGLEVVVFGGSHSDLPLEPGSGELIADAIVDHGMSAIISLRHLGKNEQKRWVTAFAERLYHRKGNPKHSGPLHMIIDEADAFAPQRPIHGDERMLGAIDDLVRRGRSAGIGVTLITQRCAAINKNVLTQTECMIALRTISPQDRKAIEEWIKAHDVEGRHDEFMGSLASLKLGEAWFWSPGWLDLFERVQVRKKRTFDSSATPKPGRRPKAPKKLAKPDLAALREQLSESIENAEAADPNKLRLRIRELERQVKAKQGDRPPDTRSVDRAVAVAVKERDKHWSRQASQLAATANKARSRLGQIHKLSETNGELAIATLEPPPASAPEPVQRVERAGTSRAAFAPHGPVAIAAGDTKLKKAEAAILRALYWLKDEEATPPKIGFYSDYTAGGGSYSNALGSLRSMGLVSGNRITPTGEAAVLAGGVEPKPTGMELREWLRPKLGKAANDILDVLIEANGKRLSAAEIGERSDYTAGGGSFSNALGRLRSLQAAEGRERDGGTKAADVFFE